MEKYGIREVCTLNKGVTLFLNNFNQKFLNHEQLILRKIQKRIRKSKTLGKGGFVLIFMP